MAKKEARSKSIALRENQFNQIRSSHPTHMHLAALEFDLAFGQCEDGVVLAELGVETGEELRAALADDDRTGLYELAAVGFHAEVLRVGIAAVLGGTGAFLMCHTNLP